MNMSFSCSVAPSTLLPNITCQLTECSSLQDAVVQVNVLFIVLVVFFSGLRMFVRLWLLRCGGFDDVLMVFAVICALILFSSCLAGTYMGLGEHIWNLDPNYLNIPEMLSTIKKLFYVCSVAYTTAMALTKLSIIASYLRIFPNEWLRRAMFIVGSVLISFWIASIFAIVFTCVPGQAAWDYSIRDTTCIYFVDFLYASAAFNIVTNIIIFVAPIPLLWALDLPSKQKYIICILFGLGLSACVPSILRVTQFYHLNGMDLSYDSVSSLNWSVAEVGTALLCASLYSLRGLASKLFPKFSPTFLRK